MSGWFIALALAIWLVAVYGVWISLRAYRSILKLVPEARKFDIMWPFGFWQFDKVAAAAGPASALLLATYRRGYAIFAVAVLMIAILSLIAGLAGNGF